MCPATTDTLGCCRHCLQETQTQHILLLILLELWFVFKQMLHFSNVTTPRPRTGDKQTV